MEERRRATATTMKHQSITSLPPSPEEERRSRMIKYSITMSIRVLCIFAMLFVDGWWLAVCAAGAIFLPYIAVVLANVASPTRRQPVLRPGAIVPRTPPPFEQSREKAPEQPDRPSDERGAA
ncbi:hypothetical protein GCM10009749_34990 [Agromyces neolithicus]|uniref:DUF3099 domain-containing protein n=2 Tax=Agromyces neolithicus TaxID=269420 RepID=A0ABP4YK92_9MICO